MTEIEALIKSLSKDGKSPRAISTELYERGMKNRAGKFLTSEMVEGFMRHGSEIGKPPAVFHDDPLKALEDEAYPQPKKYGDYSRIGGPVYDKNFRSKQMRAWPLHTDFSPDEIDTGGR
jgi:hypothetical protein